MACWVWCIVFLMCTGKYWSVVIWLCVYPSSLAHFYLLRQCTISNCHLVIDYVCIVVDPFNPLNNTHSKGDTSRFALFLISITEQSLNEGVRGRYWATVLVITVIPPLNHLLKSKILWNPTSSLYEEFHFLSGNKQNPTKGKINNNIYPIICPPSYYSTTHAHLR